MVQPRLTPIHRVLPTYLPRVAREQDGHCLLKVWLLDDTLPDGDGALSPLQEVLRRPAGRRWLHETTGELVEVFYLLDPAGKSAPEAGPEVGGLVEVESRAMPYTLAVHHVARLFGIAPEGLPALVGYLSLDLGAYCIVGFADLTNPAEVKARLAAVFEGLKKAAVAVVGAERVGALLLGGGSEPLRLDEAARIAAEFQSLLAPVLEHAWSWRSSPSSLAPTIEAIAHTLAVGAGPAPDLRLLVRIVEQGAATALTYQLHAASRHLAPRPFGPVVLRDDPRRHCEQLYDDADALDRGAAERDISELRLRAMGMALADALLPPELQELLDSLQGETESLQVISEEGWIPWELVHLPGRSPGSGRFLCEAFAITRWWLGLPQQVSLPLRRLAVVWPRDPEVAEVPGGAEEFEGLLALLRAGGRAVEPVPARYLPLIEAFAKGEHDGWHFVSHGSAGAGDPNRWAIGLAEREELKPEDLHGPARGLGKASPLVFLNGCETGRGALSLTGFGGWGRAFPEVGAGALLGSYWTVHGEAAREFALAFYQHLLAGVPLGEAVRLSRLEVRRNQAGAGWLAYTAFAHPLAACPAPSA